MNSIPLNNIAYFVVIIILVFVIARYKIKGYKKTKAMRKRFSRGRKLEAEAKGFLESKGYNVIDYQYKTSHIFNVDGEIKESTIIVDYVIEKRGKTFLVEVKSGKEAIFAKQSNTRRQLLEYDYVIENDGLFLLDMENKNLKKVKFTPKTVTVKKNPVLSIILIAIIGVFIPWWQAKAAIILFMFIIYKYPKTFSFI